MYFESMMTCARVRVYERKKEEQKQPSPSPSPSFLQLSSCHSSPENCSAKVNYFYCIFSLFNFQFPFAGIRIYITTRIIWSNSCEAKKAYLMCISIYLFLCKPILENSFLGLLKILLFLMLEKFLNV